MRLSSLMESMNGKPQSSPCGDPEIGSIHFRSDSVIPGGLFIAVKGFKADGHAFIPEAVSAGAVAIVGEDPPPTDLPVAFYRVENSRRALSAIAAKFYGEPSRRMTVIGITGTNGKTTVSYLTESILSSAGFSVGVIGTVNYRYGGRMYPNPVTTPESADLQSLLSRMKAEGVTHVVMEVSSHAIELGRVADCYFDVGVFTNLSQDHLDFHGDMANYGACKRRFFSEYLSIGPKKNKALAVINTRDEAGRSLAASLKESGDRPRVLKVGLDGRENTIQGRNVVFDVRGISGELMTPQGSYAFHSSLAGPYNLENVLCAAGVGVALGLDMKSIVRGIETAHQVPGRLERVPCPRNRRNVFVDYAHTPAALENVLHAVRSITDGRIICVFGCGGNRDRTKRPLMGAIAAEGSDLAVLTTDNPRTEDPELIIRDVLAGIQPVLKRRYEASQIRNGFSEKGYMVEPDRRSAIEIAIRAAGPDDAVLIAGKGHETYQIVGVNRIDFDDRVEASRVLQSFMD